jgi:hypothetical protein
MDSREKTIKLLESFLSDKEVDGVCGYTVVPDDGEDSIQVIVVLDIDYIKEANTKPGFVARMIREGVKQEIKKWIGLDVYVGSTAKKCDESESISESVVYDYIEGRNEAPERLPFDVNKLINAGAVFITPAIEGDSSSKNYKKFLKRPYTHLITLYNIKHSPEDSWIHTAITRFASPKHWEGKDFAKNLYDGKYNQILWSLDELGIPYESMLIDEVNESKKKYIVTESQLERLKEYFDPIHYLKKIMSDAPKYIRDPNSLKYDAAFQKVVDVIFKYTMKHSPVDNLKGVEVTKVTPQGWGSDMKDDSKGSHTEWIVLLNPKLPKWFNPDDIDYRTQLENFKKEFASIANMMGLTSTSPISQEGYPLDKVRFIISSN